MNKAFTQIFVWVSTVIYSVCLSFEGITLLRFALFSIFLQNTIFIILKAQVVTSFMNPFGPLLKYAKD